MAFFSVKVGEKTYELDRLTLGEARVLKREFGLSDLGSFSGTDPDQLVGLLYLARKRESPAMSHDEVLAEIEDLDIEAFEAPKKRPTRAAKGGSRATTPQPAGGQS